MGRSERGLNIQAGTVSSANNTIALPIGGAASTATSASSPQWATAADGGSATANGEQLVINPDGTVTINGQSAQPSQVATTTVSGTQGQNGGPTVYQINASPCVTGGGTCAPNGGTADPITINDPSGVPLKVESVIDPTNGSTIYLYVNTNNNTLVGAGGLSIQGGVQSFNDGVTVAPPQAFNIITQEYVATGSKGGATCGVIICSNGLYAASQVNYGNVTPQLLQQQANIQADTALIDKQNSWMAAPILLATAFMSGGTSALGEGALLGGGARAAASEASENLLNSLTSWAISPGTVQSASSVADELAMLGSNPPPMLSVSSNGEGGNSSSQPQKSSVSGGGGGNGSGEAPSTPQTPENGSGTGAAEPASSASGNGGGASQGGGDVTVNTDISTAKPYQSAAPRDLNEQILWNQVIADPGEGTPLEGMNNDQNFQASDGWQKMQISKTLPDGSNITIHYQYNEATNTVADMKITTPQNSNVQPGVSIK